MDTTRGKKEGDAKIKSTKGNWGALFAQCKLKKLRQTIPNQTDKLPRREKYQNRLKGKEDLGRRSSGRPKRQIVRGTLRNQAQFYEKKILTAGESKPELQKQTTLRQLQRCIGEQATPRNFSSVTGKNEGVRSVKPNTEVTKTRVRPTIESEVELGTDGPKKRDENEKKRGTLAGEEE